MNNDSLINNIYINIFCMLKIVFQKGNGLKKHLEKFWWQKINLIASPSPTGSARSLVLMKQTRLTVERLCLAFGNGGWWVWKGWRGLKGNDVLTQFSASSLTRCQVTPDQPETCRPTLKGPESSLRLKPRQCSSSGTWQGGELGAGTGARSRAQSPCSEKSLSPPRGKGLVSCE